MAKKVTFNGAEFSKCRWVLNGTVLHIQIKGCGESGNRDYGFAIDIPVERVERSFPMDAAAMLRWLDEGQRGDAESRAGTGRAYTRGLVASGTNAAGQRAILFVRNPEDAQAVRTACGAVEFNALDWVENN